MCYNSDKLRYELGFSPFFDAKNCFFCFSCVVMCCGVSFLRLKMCTLYHRLGLPVNREDKNKLKNFLAWVMEAHCKWLLYVQEAMRMWKVKAKMNVTV